MSTTNLKRALRIERNLTDSIKELLDTGEITKIFASDTIAHYKKDKNKYKRRILKYGTYRFNRLYKFNRYNQHSQRQHT